MLQMPSTCNQYRSNGRCNKFAQNRSIPRHKRSVGTCSTSSNRRRTHQSGSRRSTVKGNKLDNPLGSTHPQREGRHRYIQDHKCSGVLEECLECSSLKGAWKTPDHKHEGRSHRLQMDAPLQTRRQTRATSKVAARRERRTS